MLGVEIFCIVVTFFLFVACFYLFCLALSGEDEFLACLFLIVSVVILLLGILCTYDIHKSRKLKEIYTYTINYNDTYYYTNDYVLSNGGIEFITEEGQFVLPIEENNLNIQRND